MDISPGFADAPGRESVYNPGLILCRPKIKGAFLCQRLRMIGCSEP
jgi:hypothetical protein